MQSFSNWPHEAVVDAHFVSWGQQMSIKKHLYNQLQKLNHCVSG